METHERLKKLRKQLGFSQVQMGKILGTDASNYSRKERGEVKIYHDEWEKLARALGVSPGDIRGHGVKPSSHPGIIPSDHMGYANIPTFILETQKKYIEKLEQENRDLIEENNKLKNSEAS
ncbi:helix-turn-helix transcriptional regulator [Chryseobacterium sp. L7]|uniref:Helix-turn-helix transcriptional regulator n=1 Tax=Chryseobacterium endalhagicum TaxID=2797638 RepID=A0ABS1QJ50_9FLAO|nr:helix-turn-helix transcriptional regulator [Chryseobacterium endalhagicum]MBL1222297.1 helix-turn-helix transcriptional regulator [Chryseobacterium endalhagicum]